MYINVCHNQGTTIENSRRSTPHWTWQVFGPHATSNLLLQNHQVSCNSICILLLHMNVVSNKV
ncbi:hypothetical protein HanXRQr2_Chr05g0223161 [Helianthus annuus]|uniref:Uncharacterized protein n=1 Tax=Helianthus annuus TaxID=4232 RepID=A0A251UU42_HELAN|nr:hypothetical protein HanXRQr2_Chr05g0223161 [Helianthus annuus]